MVLQVSNGVHGRDKCSVKGLTKIQSMIRVTSCHIEHLVMDVIRPCLAIDGAEVMRAGTHHRYAVHLYFEQDMIPSLLVLHGKQVPMRDKALVLCRSICCTKRTPS